MDNLKQLLRLAFMVACCGGLLIWLHQGSLETFWQQSYHRPPPWKPLEKHAFWQTGKRVHPALGSAWQSFARELSGTTAIEPAAKATAPIQVASTPAPVPAPAFPLQCPASCLTAVLPALPADVEPAALPASGPAPETPQLAVLAAPASTPELTTGHPASPNQPASPRPKASKQQAALADRQRILLAGDSMMQGVAPHLAVRLRREYGIQSIDLSRQSTGLTYPKALNWPQLIDETLQRHSDIKVVAVFLGPNDPWDMPGSAGNTYLRFATPAWEEHYRQRIRQILTSARKHQADIIWISPPNMRRQDLSRKLDYLNGLYQSEVQRAGEIFMSANQVFRYRAHHYSDYMGDGSLKQKLRAGDGIHFTPTGQRLIADALFERLVYHSSPQATHATQPAPASSVN